MAPSTSTSVAATLRLGYSSVLVQRGDVVHHPQGPALLPQGSLKIGLLLALRIQAWVFEDPVDQVPQRRSQVERFPGRRMLSLVQRAWEHHFLPKVPRAGDAQDFSYP